MTTSVTDEQEDTYASECEARDRIIKIIEERGGLDFALSVRNRIDQEYAITTNGFCRLDVLQSINDYAEDNGVEVTPEQSEAIADFVLSTDDYEEIEGFSIEAGNDLIQWLVIGKMTDMGLIPEDY